jgi:transposase
MGKSIRNLSTVPRVGLDLAKRVFQVHAVEATGEIVVARQLTRSQLIPFFAELPPRVAGMEACSSAHHWGRALIELGHEVRLIPPAHVKPYGRRNKSDQVDAAATVSTRMARSSSPIAGVAHFVRLSAKSTRWMRQSERSTGGLRRRSRRTRRPSG